MLRNHKIRKEDVSTVPQPNGIDRSIARRKEAAGQKSNGVLVLTSYGLPLLTTLTDFTSTPANMQH
jgi:hypothetical protein